MPAGAGISSSAALEVAALRAVQGLLNLDVEPLRLAALAQQAEHRVARAPCGIMDQVTATLGRKDHLLMLRCQPAEVLGHRRLPRDAQVFGIDSGVAHRVAGDQYGRVRVATFMGRAMIAAHGKDAERADPPGGYLCNLAPERFPNKADREKAKDKPIQAVTAGDLSSDLSQFGVAGSPTWVESVQTVEVAREKKILAGDPPAQVNALVQVLLERGWKLHRIWSTDWFVNPQQATKRLIDAVNAACR